MVKTGPISRDKSQIYQTGMYLERFLPKFAALQPHEISETLRGGAVTWFFILRELLVTVKTYRFVLYKVVTAIQE